MHELVETLWGEPETKRGNAEAMDELAETLYERGETMYGDAEATSATHERRSRHETAAQNDEAASRVVCNAWQERANTRLERSVRLEPE